MCGIAGVWGESGASAVRPMTSALAHRGPDDAGFHSADGVHVGARRLSIVDLPGGSQPFYDETGRICLVANGEIYNHRELRGQLQARGHSFRSQCDVEVIVHLYEEHGDACVDWLRGMFAFAIADGSRLLLARDRLGIKPLHYSVLPDAVVFGSEIKAVLRHPAVPSRLDLQALADVTAIGYPVEGRTMLADVRSLPPGHTMVVTKGPAGPLVDMARYYRLPAEPDESITFDEAQDTLIGLLREVTASHLAADVGAGLLLSGGLDSTVLALAARDVGATVPAFSAGDHAGHADLCQAAVIAGELGWPYSAALLDFDRYLDWVPRMVHSAETPSIFGMANHILGAEVGGRLKVCLSGEGADELFGGYPWHSPQPRPVRDLADRLRAVRDLGISLSPRAAEISDIWDTDWPMPTYLDRVLALDMAEQLVARHLEPLDKATMAAGVEARVPFLDHHLAEFVIRLPTRYKVNSALGIQKHVLRRAALRAWGHEGPIADTILRTKLGAPSATGVHQRTLGGYCARQLPDDYLSRHELGSCFRTRLHLLVFELWHEMFVTGRGADPGEFPMAEFIAERAGRAVEAR
jgi:asparagine synthase (glutamine-hydrolysing)